jgi:pheromone shutdown protein TraB
MEPGAEFRAAYDAACERNSRVLMGDQSINTTFSRLRQVLPSELPALLSSSLTGQSIFSNMPQEVRDVLSSSDTSFESAVERMKDRRVVRAMSSSLRSSVPQITRVMLDERDDALANSILEQPAGSKVVAIVGMAHLEGVASRLRDNS